MDFATLSSVITVLAVVVFAGIVGWTLSRRQTKRFAAAAQLPFALPDDAVTADPVSNPSGAKQ